MSEKTIPITLWLAGRDYRIRILPKDEEAVRSAIKIVSDKMHELKESHDGKDDQDFLSMCLIMYAIQNISGAKESDPVYVSELKAMEDKIDSILS